MANTSKNWVYIGAWSPVRLPAFEAEYPEVNWHVERRGASVYLVAGA